ncbi:MAG TPA: hypothetical protein VFZ06_02365 [Acidimicrobiia bacterium]|nr:hypothetical protein [Acidimicrobiia bacterium]
MSFHRFLYVAGWSAVILLAIAGFAAFNAGTPPSTPLVTQGQVLWGEAAGAVSAQGWLAMAGTKAAAPEVAAPPTTAAAVTARSTTSLELNTGWLDSVALRSLIEDNFASSDVNKAVRLAWCLSRFDVDLVNPDLGLLGLFQIAPSDWNATTEAMGLGGADPFDPGLNVAVAAHIVYQGPGWGYWSCS